VCDERLRGEKKYDNTGPEKHQPSNEGDLPVVLLHGTSGQSEDWSQVVEQLTRHRPVIRLNYAEPVTGTDSANVPAVSDLADRVVAAARAGGRHRFDLVGFSLGARLLHSLPRNMRRWFVHWFLYQASVMAVIRE
jgi:pimeloyl-ACP methyl ester carboxylesterase